MYRLLAANFYRLRKDVVFRVTAVCVFCSALAVSFSTSNTVVGMLERGYPVTLDDYFFYHAQVMGIYFAVFISLFLGTEYADGTLRNKLVIGHKRKDIYLSNYLTCFLGSLFFLLIWWIASVPGLFIVGELKMGLWGFFICALAAVGFTAAFNAVFTMAASLSSNKALTIIYCLAAWMLMLLLSSALYDRLLEPEFSSPVILTENGFERKPSEPNPLYVSGSLRTVFSCILECLPAGQANLLAGNELTNPFRAICFSAVITMLVTLVGIKLFCRKDIK